MSTAIGDQLFLVALVLIGVFLMYKQIKMQQDIAEAHKKADAAKAVADAAWAVDYHNPASATYDAVKTKTEADAAWLLDPSNPDSFNYDPSI